MSEAKQIAEATLMYLGGSNRLRAMLGAEQISYDDNGTLKFMFKMCKKANYVEFHLNGADLYDVKFFKINKKTLDKKLTVELNDLFFEQLREVFERETGLYLTL